MWPFTRKSPEEKLAAIQEKTRIREEKARLREERAAEQREFDLLLEKAAAISSTKIVCHRDTWRFANSLARDRVSYTPPTSMEITELPNAMLAIRLSGPNLVTLLIVTREIGSNSYAYAGNRAIASRMYTAIAEVVNTVDMSVKGGTAVPPIIIDAAPRGDENEPELDAQPRCRK